MKLWIVGGVTGFLGLALGLRAAKAASLKYDEMPEPDEPMPDVSQVETAVPVSMSPTSTKDGNLLSAHFTPKEFAQPAKHGFARIAYPEEWIDSRLRPLVDVLERLRTELSNKSMRVNSAYRSPTYNKAIGGAQHSQHTFGRAADIVVSGVSAKTVHDTALRLHNEGVIRLGGLGRYSTFTHVDLRPGSKLAQWNG